METSGYVLVCESFEFEHDYKDALESVGSRGQLGNLTFERTYYVLAVENH